MSASYNDVLSWWRSQKKNTIDDYKLLIDNFQVVFATNTNQIEGVPVSYNTTRAVFEGANISNYTGSLDSLFLVRNQKFAFEFMLKSLIQKEPITLDFIRKLHKILMYGSYDEARWKRGERPGTFKVHDYCVGMLEVGSFPDEVEGDLESLLEELEDTSDNKLLLKAAYFHAVFETIHPFADGNGRVGRTLLNYYLMLHDYPPLVIYDEDKNTYYMALEVFNRTEDLSGMRAFIEEQTIKTWCNHVSPNLSKLEWCKRNAPAPLRDLYDDEIVSLMSDAYERAVSMGKVRD